MSKFSSDSYSLSIPNPSSDHPESTMARCVVPESQPLIFVVLDCIYYVAGDKISGEAILNLPEDMPGGMISLQARGVEEIMIFDPQNQGQAKHEANSVVFDLECRLQEWKTMVPAGQYVFPYTLKIPDYAPATLYFSGEDSKGNYIKAQISYTITCKFQMSTGQNKTLQHSRTMILRNKDSKRKPTTILETARSIQGCCCTYKGSTLIKLSVRGEFHPQIDGILKYKLDPDNINCKAPINHVTGSVLMSLKFTLPSGTYFVQRNLSSISRATWISAHTNLIYEKDFEYTSDLRMHTEELNPSSNRTPLILCEYRIQVLIYYDLACKSEPILVEMPVHVDPKDTFVRDSPILPKPWEPQEASIQNFAIQALREINMAAPTYPNQ